MAQINNKLERKILKSLDKHIPQGLEPVAISVGIFPRTFESEYIFKILIRHKGTLPNACIDNLKNKFNLIRCMDDYGLDSSCFIIEFNNPEDIKPILNFIKLHRFDYFETKLHVYHEKFTTFIYN